MAVKTEHYPNGQLRYRITYSQGQRHGVEEWWYPNGQLRYRIPYSQGKRHGVAEAWYKNGQPEYRYYYLHNQEVTKEEYRRYQLIEQLSGLK